MVFDQVFGNNCILPVDRANNVSSCPQGTHSFMGLTDSHRSLQVLCCEWHSPLTSGEVISDKS